MENEARGNKKRKIRKNKGMRSRGSDGKREEMKVGEVGEVRR